MAKKEEKPNGPLAPYAVADNQTRGRAQADPYAGGQGPFEVDRQRIINCMAFRRLGHKTQVFVTGVGDHFRTRLTHTLEVVAQAQRLAGLLSLNGRLAGAIALAHDLGHAPFGHAGEKALAELMEGHGGFEHNLQSLRVVDYLEHPYPDFRGLNLSFEVRESLIKHQTWYDKPDRGGALDESTRMLVESGPMASLEGQIVDLADPIAYTLHDIEDGLGQGVLTETALAQSAIWKAAAEPVRRAHPDAPLHAIRRPILDRIAAHLAEDAAAESARRIAEARVNCADDVRRCDQELIAFSSKTQAGMEELGRLLYTSVYRTYAVVRMDSKARRLIRDLFEAYLAEPALMPERFSSRLSEQEPHRVICDYIAGMTDRYCQEEHRRLFAPFYFG
jgi:dGTPase